jgi:hypothetical protein
MTDTSREIDWQSVEVRDGNVLVMLTGAASKQWGEHFQAVLKLLTQGNTAWGEVSLGKKGIKVEALQPGAEDDLRHLLESVVMQVNTELAPDPGDEAVEAEDPQVRADRKMAETLKAFGEPEPQ